MWAMCDIDNKGSTSSSVTLLRCNTKWRWDERPTSITCSVCIQVKKTMKLPENIGNGKFCDWTDCHPPPPSTCVYKFARNVSQIEIILPRWVSERGVITMQTTVGGGSVGGSTSGGDNYFPHEHVHVLPISEIFNWINSLFFIHLDYCEPFVVFLTMRDRHKSPLPNLLLTVRFKWDPQDCG